MELFSVVHERGDPTALLVVAVYQTYVRCEDAQGEMSIRLRSSLLEVRGPIRILVKIKRSP